MVLSTNTTTQANNLKAAYKQAQANNQSGHPNQVGAKQKQVGWHALTHYRSS